MEKKPGTALSEQSLGASGSLTRNTSIDFVKGVMITLMVLFHYDAYGFAGSLTSVTDWLTVSFFLPIFFFISGYFTKPQEPLSCLKKSADRIGRPYIVFSLLYMLLVFLGQCGLYTIREQLVLDTPLAWLKILATGSAGPFYYLYTLLFFRLAVSFVWRICRTSAGRWIVLVSVCLVLGQLPIRIGAWPYLFLGLAWSFLGIPMCFGWYGIIPIIFESAVVSCAVLSGNPWKFPDITELHVQVAWLLGWLSVTISISRWFPTFIARLIETAGKNSLSILVMHIFVLKAWILVRQPLSSVDHTGLADVAVATGLGVWVPVLATRLLDKMRIGRYLFGHGK